MRPHIPLGACLVTWYIEPASLILRIRFLTDSTGCSNNLDIRSYDQNNFVLSSKEQHITFGTVRLMSVSLFLFFLLQNTVSMVLSRKLVYSRNITTNNILFQHGPFEILISRKSLILLKNYMGRWKSKLSMSKFI